MLLFFVSVLSSGDVDAELERLDPAQTMPVILENQFSQSKQAVTPAPRPLSPTRLQPVVAPEAQSQEIPDKEELLRIRAEIPRPLKRRGSMDQSQPLKKASHYQPNQYKHIIHKMLRKKERRPKGDQSSDTNSSSDGEDCAMPPSPAPKKSTGIPQEVRVTDALRCNRLSSQSKRKRRKFLKVCFYYFRATIPYFGGLNKNTRVLGREPASAHMSWRWMEHWLVSWRRCRKLYKRSVLISTNLF